MSDIVERLRASVTQCRAVDRSQLLEEAAAEIERLRSGAAAIRETGALCSDAAAYTAGIPASNESK